jgi:hypothetical protein
VSEATAVDKPEALSELQQYRLSAQLGCSVDAEVWHQLRMKMDAALGPDFDPYVRAECFAALDAIVKQRDDARAALTAAEKPAYLRGKRSIVAAAVLLSNGVVVCGVRHFDKLMRATIQAIGTSEGDVTRIVSGSVQGFVDNNYEFVGRDEAWIIAERAGQFDPKKATGTQGTLYSEDLW